MEVRDVTKQGVLVYFELDEVRIVSNAFNEVLHGLSVPEFSTRMGAERSEAEAILHTLHSAYRSGMGEA
jgi:hypothetical protein